MASSAAVSNRGKVTMEYNPYRRVRIVGKIRCFTDSELESSTQDSKDWISVFKNKEGASPESGVTLSCSHPSVNRKDGPFVLDYCYEQHEDIDTIFAREIKPLISDVLSGGTASVIAYGAKGSGKTYTIQGSLDKPGLAVLSMNELLSKAEEAGKAVSVSILEVYQERAYDLLDPKHVEVQFLGDGRGKINLKGLTHVSVKSILEFQNMYLNKLQNSKPVQKIPLEQPKRSHKCLMMQLSKVDDNSNLKLEGRMLFIDLAGYEDARRSSRDGAALHEATKTNISLQAVMNVVYALNANEVHVPYRESKLTRILQESLGGTNHAVMLTCLNPQFCQDTLRTLSLASRSCQSTNHIMTNSSKGDKSSSRFKLLSSQRKMPSTTPTTLKKPASSTVHVSTKKASCVSKGRKLFDAEKKAHSIQVDKAQQGDDELVRKLDFKPEDAVSSTLVPQVSEDDKPISETSLDLELREDALQHAYPADHPLTSVPVGMVSQYEPKSEFCSDLELKENDASANNIKNNMDVNPQIICENSSMEDGKKYIHASNGEIGKQNWTTAEGGSPPLSAKLQELSNQLKSMFSSTPLSIKVAEDFNGQLSVQPGYGADLNEPKTPTVEHGMSITQGLDITKYNSPWDRLSARSSGMKDSLVQEYLKFFNTAGKEELKGVKGIGEKRATYILELRDESPEPFKNLDDLENIGLSAKQVKGLMKNMAGNLFN